MKAPRNKLDARSRRELERGGKDDRIHALVRLAGPPSDNERKALEKTGCTITASAGAVVSISIDAKCVRKLAALDFVRSIETARTLRAES